jgi:hypothetical protein
MRQSVLPSTRVPPWYGGMLRIIVVCYRLIVPSSSAPGSRARSYLCLAAVLYLRLHISRTGVVSTVPCVLGVNQKWRIGCIEDIEEVCLPRGNLRCKMKQFKGEWIRRKLVLFWRSRAHPTLGTAIYLRYLVAHPAIYPSHPSLDYRSCEGSSFPYQNVPRAASSIGRRDVSLSSATETFNGWSLAPLTSTVGLEV